MKMGRKERRRGLTDCRTRRVHGTGHVRAGLEQFLDLSYLIRDGDVGRADLTYVNQRQLFTQRQ